MLVNKRVYYVNSKSLNDNNIFGIKATSYCSNNFFEKELLNYHFNSKKFGFTFLLCKNSENVQKDNNTLHFKDNLSSCINSQLK